MSGGFFNYLSGRNSVYDLATHLEDLQCMADALKLMGAYDAACETELIIADLAHVERRVRLRADRLSCLWHAVEWWKSGDSSEADAREALREYRGGKDG